MAWVDIFLHFTSRHYSALHFSSLHFPFISWILADKNGSVLSLNFCQILEVVASLSFIAMLMWFAGRSVVVVVAVLVRLTFVISWLHSNHLDDDTRLALVWNAVFGIWFRIFSPLAFGNVLGEFFYAKIFAFLFENYVVSFWCTFRCVCIWVFSYACMPRCLCVCVHWCTNENSNCQSIFQNKKKKLQCLVMT